MSSTGELKERMTPCERNPCSATVRIYSPAKTVADCFKFRNKIGLDVAIEALREALRAKRCTREELWAAGKVCRVSTVIRPYLEAI